MNPQVIAVAVVAGLAIWGGSKVVHGVKKVVPKIVHVVTLGKK